MAGTVLQVVESLGGWRLLDDGLPIFWFPERHSALETARVMADAPPPREPPIATSVAGHP